MAKVLRGLADYIRYCCSETGRLLGYGAKTAMTLKYEHEAQKTALLESGHGKHSLIIFDVDVKVEQVDAIANFMRDNLGVKIEDSQFDIGVAAERSEASIIHLKGSAKND